MDEQLVYTKHDAAGRNGESSPNGTRSKIVITEVDPVEVDVPRDRDNASNQPRSASGSAG